MNPPAEPARPGGSSSKQGAWGLCRSMTIRPAARVLRPVKPGIATFSASPCWNPLRYHLRKGHPGQLTSGSSQGRLFPSGGLPRFWYSTSDIYFVVICSCGSELPSHKNLSFSPPCRFTQAHQASAAFPEAGSRHRTRPATRHCRTRATEFVIRVYVLHDDRKVPLFGLSGWLRGG